MKSKQKLIIAVLAIANGIVILALVIAVASSPGSPPASLPNALTTEDVTEAPPRSEEPPSRDVSTPSGSREPSSRETCQWEAAQMLAQEGLGGTVTLAADGALRFSIVYHPAQNQTASETEPLDRAAQLVWEAFDIALALNDAGCGLFTQVEVAILIQDSSGARISASVSAADLSAFGAGELSENEFIQRVAYQVSNR